MTSQGPRNRHARAGRPQPWERLSTRLVGPLRAELVDLETGAVVPRRCSCPQCVEAEAQLRPLFARRVREHTKALIRHAAHFHAHLWRSYTLACRPGSAETLAAARDEAIACQRFVDELGRCRAPDNAPGVRRADRVLALLCDRAASRGLRVRGCGCRGAGLMSGSGR